MTSLRGFSSRRAARSQRSLDEVDDAFATWLELTSVQFLWLEILLLALTVLHSGYEASAWGTWDLEGFMHDTTVCNL